MKKFTQSYSILVIEDNDGDFLLIHDYLEEVMLQPKMQQVRSFRQAKAQLRSTSSTYDVILLDLSLPDVQGQQLVKELLRLCNNVPVIVLTDYSDISFGVQSLSLGVSDYLLKEELTPWILFKSIVYSIERRNINNQLIESEERYRGLFHFSPQPMWVIDYKSLKILDVNQAAIRQYGYSKEEFLSMNFHHLQPVEAHDGAAQGLNLTTQPDNSYLLGLKTLETKEGKAIQAEIQGSEINFKGSLAVLILANDITERLNYISAIESQNQRLQEIAWIQSHVVRAPLARLMGLIFLVQDVKHSPTETCQLLEHIINSAGELDGVIREITLKSEHTNQKG